MWRKKVEEPYGCGEGWSWCWRWRVRSATIIYGSSNSPSSELSSTSVTQPNCSALEQHIIFPLIAEKQRWRLFRDAAGVGPRQLYSHKGERRMLTRRRYSLTFAWLHLLLRDRAACPELYLADRWDVCAWVVCIHLSVLFNGPAEYGKWFCHTELEINAGNRTELIPLPEVFLFLQNKNLTFAMDTSWNSSNVSYDKHKLLWGAVCKVTII